MKKFFGVLVTMLVLTNIEVNACACERTHNFYLFDIIDCSFCKERKIVERCNAFWAQYTNSQVTEYKYHEQEIMDYARAQRDQEMITYLTELNNYLEISGQLEETWDYPTKEQLQARQHTLEQMAQKALAYNGTRLKGQWALLHMRANMVMKRHQNNIDYWNNIGKRLPESVYREMMENIYAGALMHMGQRKQAIDIFAGQGDFLSVQWLLRKHRNLNGIKSVYAEDPKSPSLLFLVQDFVNNAQETLDDTDENGEIDAEWIETVNARVIKKDEVQSFIQFAKQVINDGKNPYPSMWKSAIGELQYLYGDRTAAVQTLTEAMEMNGTPRMKANARSIRMVAAVGTMSQEALNKWIMPEISWLKEMGKSEGSTGEYYYENQYTQVMERLIYLELVPYYKKVGNQNMVTALYDVITSADALWGIESEEYEDSSWNPNYSMGYYSEELNRMTADQLVDFAKWLQQKPSDEMERFVKQNIKYDADFFNDMIGTHYIAEAKFEKAITYLQKVPLSFLEGQNISFYLANRDFTKARWITKQGFRESQQTEGAHLAKLYENPKLRYCEEVVKWQKKYQTSKKMEKEQAALQLARYYYQASIWGECWYLTHYGKGFYDKTLPHEADLVAMAREMLQVSKKSTDFSIKEESLFALAFIPADPFNEESFFYGIGDHSPYDWKGELLTRNNSDFAALCAFARANPGKLDSYVTKCDVLRFYMRNQ